MDIIDLYMRLFGRGKIADGSVIDMAEHGRVGGLSTGQPFKFVAQTPGVQTIYAEAADGPNAGTIVAIPAIYNATEGRYELATAGSGGTPSTPYYLLLEDDSYLLQESGDKIIL
jgi:hypothetical protein